LKSVNDFKKILETSTFNAVDVLQQTRGSVQQKIPFF